MDIELRIKIIERFDSYFSGINNKGAFLLAFNTFLIGAFVVGYRDLINLVDCQYKCEFTLMIGLLMTFSIIAMALTIISMIPYLVSKGADNKKSNWFFNDIASDDKETFVTRINNSTEDDILSDLNNQIFELSKGLQKKHRFVKVALISNLIGIILLIPILIIILIKP